MSRFTRIDDIALGSEALPREGSGARRFRVLRLRAAWGRAVGERLARVSSVTDHRGEVLTVEVRDPSWRPELARLEPEILRRLSRSLPGPSLRRLRITVNPSGPTPSPAAPPPSVVPRETAENPTPQELQRRLQDVRRRYLARSSRGSG